jgi:mRNA interferase RelE/StbE
MSYRLILQRSAEREWHGLPPDVEARVTAALLRLREEPRPRGVRKLADGIGFRLRVGDYRILYVVDDGARKVVVYAIGHRRDVYRG